MPINVKNKIKTLILLTLKKNQKHVFKSHKSDLIQNV